MTYLYVLAYFIKSGNFGGNLGVTWEEGWVGPGGEHQFEIYSPCELSNDAHSAE